MILLKLSTTRDTEEKFDIYQKYGVSEYWLLFPEQQCIEVYTLENSIFTIYCSTEKTDGKVIPKVLTGLELDSNLIF